MPEKLKIVDLDFEVGIEDLLGPLGYSDVGNVKPEIMDQILSETERCRVSMTGKAAYSLMEFRSVPDSAAINVGGKIIEEDTLTRALEGASALAVAVCTVGPGIDGIIEAHFDGGDYLRGMIADVVGNRAAEGVANKCAGLICTEARELELFTSRQISPGYGKWDTSGQRPLFELIDPSPIGVSLNEQCMMEPKKSVSFIVPLVVDEPELDDRPPCYGCNLKECSYRRK